MRKLTTIAMLSVLSIGTFGAEVDQFTKRNDPLLDSSQILNAKANEYVQKSLKVLNESSINCSTLEAEKNLYKELRKYFANHTKGELTIYALKSDDVQKRKLKIQDSVFRDWTIFDGYLLGKPSANNSDLALGPLVRMNDVVIGTDKLEHLFGRGFSYFTNYYLKGKSLKRTLKSGVFGEKTIYGGNKIATGVFSYADLSANFNGMRFWNHMLQKREDVMGDNFGPYIICSNGKGWEQVKEIDFTHYFDASHDEAINCSKFPTKKTAKKYANVVKELAAEKTHFVGIEGCPIDPNALEAMKQKYGKFAKDILNLSSNDREVSYFNEF